MSNIKLKLAALIAILISGIFYVDSYARVPLLKKVSVPRNSVSQKIFMNVNPSTSRRPEGIPAKAASEFIASTQDTPKISKTLKKILPLGAMLFFILFNYTILRDTKDVLVVTAPGGGAEIIPFLKTYVNLPSSIGFAVLYGILCNKMSTDNVFYLVMSSFIAFFGSFASFIYPNRALFHPNKAADWLASRLPVFFLPMVAIFRNWTYALFYTLANMW